MYIRGIGEIPKSVGKFFRIVVTILLVLVFLAVICAAAVGLFYGVIYLASLAWHSAQ